ncbi:tyrosine-protein phosphatase non-receptor type 13 [Sinocyclocheilus rhinocerous]|uniref:tyrosine-protein phosphatase non-receptor type 13 n=1 Tax=Sinocyclocheilus rhinocerous TaxID=307959 RepID=UPI0007B981B7|nr:PREDICTED: tyrosine-protein phosphatase non-receptor type 13-like [Sinocyclocheilus rhinocerous]
MSTFVTLAEVLESRGAPLEEDEVWALLLGAAETLISISSKDPGNMCCVISPGSMLLSAVGSIAFKSCGRAEDMSSFASPEMSQSNPSFRRQATEKMVVYSLGMTLYWTVDYHLPQNQPIRLSDSLNSLLLSMCEDVAHKRVNLLTVLETCEQHHKTTVLPRPQKAIRQMAEDVLQAERNPNDSAHLTDRSQMVRERLRGASRQNSVWPFKGNSTPSPADFSRSAALNSSLQHQAYNEFFFLDNDTKISKVAPGAWKKVPSATFVLHFRIRYFVNDVSVLLHKLTRHQYYLQLRRDILDDRLPCNEETCLFLGALALQAEFGDSMPEVWGKNYYQPEHYVSKSVLQKMAMPCLKQELLRLHANNANMSAEEAELEFLKSIQQLPEYGVLFHRAAREKKPVFGELLLGVCAKGVIVYEVINNSQTASLRFHWRETTNITSARRKFIIESSTSKKKHIFLTEKSKVAKYLCDLCSAQHKFHKEMSSRQLTRSLASEESMVQYAAACRTQNDEHNGGRLDASMSRFCEDVASRIEVKIKQQRDFLDHTGSQSPAFQRSSCSSPKRCYEVPSMSSPLRDTPTSVRSPEREIICVSLKKDPKVGLGIVIVGEDNAGKLDLGIFIASIVPGGPADRDGRIKPGGRLISLNQLSLEGVSFSEAADIMQSSSSEVELIVSQTKVPGGPADRDGHIKPGGRLISLNQLSLEGVSFSEAADIMQSSSSEVELIVSQTKALFKRGGAGHLAERNCESQSTILADGQAGDHYLDELVSVMMTPKGTNRLHVPEVRIINAQDDYSRSASLISLRPEDFTVTLQKSGGSLGISIAGGVNTGLRYGGIYIKSLVPGGAAEQDGHIQTGDRLLEVDGTRLQGFTDQQAAECLARTGEVVSLVLERDGGSVLQQGPVNTLTIRTPSPAGTPMRNSCPAITMTRPFGLKSRDYSFVSHDNIQEVTLKKRLNGLGFSFFITELDTSLDSGSIVRIRKLFPGQPAEESGKIREGDVILSINGEPLKGLSYQQVLQLLRNSPSEVQLLLCRPAQGIERMTNTDNRFNIMSFGHFDSFAFFKSLR